MTMVMSVMSVMSVMAFALAFPFAFRHIFGSSKIKDQTLDITSWWFQPI